METVPCPGCSTALEPSATVCPICTRPRGKLEITRAYATLREAEKQRRKRPFVILVYVLAAGAASWLALRFHAPVIAAAKDGYARATRFMDEQLDSAMPKPTTAPPPPADTPEPATPPRAAASAPTATVPAASSASSPPAPTPAAGPSTVGAAGTRTGKPSSHADDLAAPPIDSSRQFAVYGRVYDLMSLKPVEGVQLSFVTPAGAYGPSFFAVSDEFGRFQSVLNRLPQGNYEIHAVHAGYAGIALYESDIPYATLPFEERRDIARNAMDGDMTFPPITDITGEERLRRDVFIAPGQAR